MQNENFIKRETENILGIRTRTKCDDFLCTFSVKVPLLVVTMIPLYLVLSYLSCTCTLVYLYWNPLQANSTRTCLFLELYYSSTFMYYSSFMSMTKVIKVNIFWVAKASYKQNYVIHPHSLLQLYSFLCY